MRSHCPSIAFNHLPAEVAFQDPNWLHVGRGWQMQVGIRPFAGDRTRVAPRPASRLLRFAHVAALRLPNDVPGQGQGWVEPRGRRALRSLSSSRPRIVWRAAGKERPAWWRGRGLHRVFVVQSCLDHCLDGAGRQPVACWATYPRLPLWAVL